MSPSASSRSDRVPRDATPSSPFRTDDILNSISDAFIAVDPDWRITFVNAAYLQLVAPLHASAADLVGHSLWEKFPDIVDTPPGRYYRQSMTEQRPVDFEIYYAPLHTWLDIRTYPSTQGLAIYARNVTQRKKQEAQLATLSRQVSEQAQLFDAILSNGPDLAFAFDRDLRFLYANKPLAALFGRPLDQIVGKTCLELGYSVELATRLESQLRAVFTTGKEFHGETLFSVSEGRTDYHNYIYSPAFSADGTVNAVVGITRVETERKHLQSVAEQQRRVLQLTAEGAALRDVLTQLVHAVELELSAKARASILLFDAGEKRLRHGAAPSLPDAYNAAIDGIEIGPEVGACGAAAWSRQQVFSPDIANDPHWAPVKDLALAHGLHACWSTPIFSGDGAVLGTFALYFSEPRGPTETERRVIETASQSASVAIERKLAEDALQLSERQLRLVADHASVLLAHMGRDYHYKFANRPYAARYGRTPEEVVGRPAIEVVGQDLFERARPYIDRALAGEEVEFELDITRPGHETRWSNAVYTPERDASGDVVGFIAVHTDITLRKRAQLDATHARDEAIRAGRAKDDFLAALSHELRTPLNPVLLLASESANNPELPSEVRADFSTIAKNARLEARLIDDLLDLTRITRGKMSLDLEPIDVHAVLRDAVDNVRADLDAQSLVLEMELCAPRSVLTGDPARLQQVFWNVLKNAVKFTPAGGRIRLETSLDAHGNSLCITISDTGIGMTAEELPRVFNSFEQGDHSRDSESGHRFGGLGLGLSISRRLVELHSGTISASSPGRGKGSIFSIQLPFSRPTSGATASRSSRSPLPPVVSLPPAPAAPVPILLIEDHAPTRAALSQLLTRRKFAVTSAASVAEALAAAEQHTFAFVVSDIGLPDGNGYQLMTTLRDLYGLRGIALSGYGMEQDIAQGRTAGFVAHLIKPVDVRTLESALAAIRASSPT